MPKEGIGDNEALRCVKTKHRIEKMILRGINNYEEIGAAFGLSKSSIRAIVAEIRKEWKEDADGNTADDVRIHRVRQLESILHMSVTAFERSKMDEETVSSDIRVCAACNGRKQLEELPDQFKDCEACAGTGKISVERITVKTGSGDPAFLNVGIAAIKEIGKLEGLTTRVGELGTKVFAQTVSVVNHNGLQQAAGGYFDDLYAEAPHDTLISALRVIEDIKLLRDDKEKKKAAGVVVVENPKKKEGKGGNGNAGDETETEADS